MATLVLTAAGNAIGGPIGAAIGSIIGQQIDQSLFGPKARQGPRLGNLAVQTSAYGNEIPKVFGTMRVAGTVIWATDLIETRASSGGGKGRPKTISYSYSANFAVALSGRPILAVRRIWADGKLLRGAAGDFKSATAYRLHLGAEDQDPDPLIVSAQGAGQVSAFRGTAYAVFENFELEDYGNRIPSLTFEVEADSVPVAIGRIAEVLGGTGVAALGPTSGVSGYAATGGSVRAAIEALAETAMLPLADQGGVVGFGNANGSPVAIDPDEETERRRIVRRAAGSTPAEVSVGYYDVARDYQAGLQRAIAGSPDGGIVDRRDLPVCLSASEAKAFAERRLAALRAGRTTARLSLGWRRSQLRPGDRVMMAGEAGLWRVRRWTLGPMLVEVELVRIGGGGPVGSVPATPGAGVSQPDLVHGVTTLRLFDLPLGEPQGAQPFLFAVAAGIDPGWRRAALMASFDGGATWQDHGSTAQAAVMGAALDMWLESASDDALAGGANLAFLGNELLQFGVASWLGGRRFRLARLLRGRRGTEWATGEHDVGEAFTLIERESLAVVEAPVGATGGEARLMASGVGDIDPLTVTLAVTAESLRPPSPVHLGAVRLANDDIDIGWIRRSRLGWSWTDGADTPLGEEGEAYRLVLSGPSFERSLTLNSPCHLYTAAEQAADGLIGTLGITVQQIGTYAASRPAALLFE